MYRNVNDWKDATEAFKILLLSQVSDFQNMRKNFGGKSGEMEEACFREC
jgi:hypothetical protein